MRDELFEQLRKVDGYAVVEPFVVFRRLPDGCLGSVYLANDVLHDRDVAVQLVRAPADVDRLLERAIAAFAVHDPNLLVVHEARAFGGVLAVVHEHVPGESLRDYAARRGPLPTSVALPIVLAAAKGLAAAHQQGIAHGAFGPDTVWLGRERVVRIAGLGLQPLVAPPAALFTAPERRRGEPASLAADVWALGALLRFLLTGSVDEAMPLDAVGEVPEPVAAWVAQASAPQASARPADARRAVALLAALDGAGGALPDDFGGDSDLQQTMVSVPRKVLATFKQRFTAAPRPASPATDPLPRPAAPPAPPAALGETTTSGARTMVSPGPRGTQAMPPPKGTLVMPPPAGGTVPVPPPRSPAVPSARRSLVPLLGALVVVAGLAAAWHFGLLEAMRAEAPAVRLQRLVAERQFADALEFAEQQMVIDPLALGGRPALAPLHGAWAQDLAAEGRLTDALVQVDRSLEIADSAAVRAQKDVLLATIGRSIDSVLVRQEPAVGALLAPGPATFRGRLADPMVRELRLGGTVAARQPDGSFQVTREVPPAGVVAVAVEVGARRDVVALAPWQVRIQPKDPVALEVPEQLVIDGDQPARLTVRSVAGAAVAVDGAPARQVGGDGTIVVAVQSAADTPAPVVVTATLAGYLPARREVQLRRELREFQFRQRPGFEAGVVEHDGRRVTAAARVAVTGVIDSAGAEVQVGTTKAVTDADGRFRAEHELPTLGVHQVPVVVGQRFRRPFTTELIVHRIAEVPALARIQPLAAESRTDAASQVVEVDGDAWTVEVDLVVGGRTVRCTRVGATSTRFRGEADLVVGRNTIEVRSRNVVGGTATLRLVVERNRGRRSDPPREPDGPPPVQPPPGDVQPPTATPPQVQLLLRKPGAPDRAITAGERVFVRLGVQLVVSGPAGAEKPRVNGTPVDYGPLDPSVFLSDGRWRSLVLEAAAAPRETAGLRVDVLFDTLAPRVEGVTVAAAPDDAAQVVVRGRWLDDGGLDTVLVAGVEAKAKGVRAQFVRGDFEAHVPRPPAAADLPLVVRDRAGNELVTTVPWQPPPVGAGGR
jgi:hypothetical protein